MGLATEARPGEWHISNHAEGTIRVMGEREDIIKSMHRALEGNGLNDERGIAQMAVHSDKLRERITGRVLARDLAGDGNGDRVQLVIDVTDGRLHQIELPIERCDGISRGMIVAAVPPSTEPRAADHNILAATDSDGTYHPSRHIEIARQEKIIPDPERFVAAHVRRLEALRRAGILERWSADHWKVPGNLPERGLTHDWKVIGPGARLETLSPLGLDRQVTHDGATWLDKKLMRRGGRDVREEGFGLETKRALDRRKQVLVQRGDAQDHGQGRVPSSNGSKPARSTASAAPWQMTAVAPGPPSNPATASEANWSAVHSFPPAASHD